MVFVANYVRGLIFKHLFLKVEDLSSIFSIWNGKPLTIHLNRRRIVYYGPHSKFRLASHLVNRTLEIGTVSSEALSPLFFGDVPTDLLQLLCQQLVVHNIIRLHALVDSECVIVSNSLFARSSDSVVMLFDTHDVH